MTMTPKNPTHFAVIGTGTMGAMIALTVARAGHAVRLWSNDAQSVARAEQAIAASLGLMTRKGILTDLEAGAILKRLSWPQSLALAVTDVAVVIEAVPENRSIKSQIFDELAQLTGDATAIWSNTSSLDVFSLAPDSLQARLMIAHFFHPAHILPLVELVRGPATSQDHLDQATALLRGIGKSPVVMQSYVAGFAINRLLRALGREAFHLIDGGFIGIEDLDIAVKTSIAPRMMLLGVMQRYDFTDLRISAANLANADFVDAPADPKPASLMTRVERGDYGVKTGQGFYDYGGASEADILSGYEDELWDVVLNAPDPNTSVKGTH